MDQSNYKNVLLAENEEHKNKVQIILNELYPNVDVPDPYFGMTNGFEIVYHAR
jgi:protein-tyrosine phosphatase